MILTAPEIVCAHCGHGFEDCICVERCDFCQEEHWADELEDVQDRYLWHRLRCWECKKGGC